MARKSDPIRREVERLRESLRSRVEGSGVEPAVIAERMGMSEKEWSKILREDGPPLKLWQVFTALTSVDVSPQEFFADFYDLSFRGLKARVTELAEELVERGVVTRAELAAAASKRSSS